MMQYLENHKSKTVPILRYQDAKKSIVWLCKTFGFEVFLEVAGKNEAVEHARLVLGDSMVMIASFGRDGDFENSFVSPVEVGGVTQCTSIYVEDPENIYKMVIEAGAEIIDKLAEYQFGGRTFSCKDIESNVWIFTSHNPWGKFW